VLRRGGRDGGGKILTGGVGAKRAPVSVPLPRANGQHAPIQIDVLDAELERFEEPHAPP